MTLFSGERAVVIGLGASGVAAARALADEGASVRVTEQRPKERVARDAEGLASIGAEVLAGGHVPEHLDEATVVVTSPGVPPHAPVLAWAADRDLPVWSELELGARLCPVPYVAITGTNGKTTTTEMVAAVMRESGLDAVACGNIGYPFSTAAREKHDALAVEASSFQLKFHESFHPRVSVLLNIAPDHLDWHGSLEEYVRAKARIFELQNDGDTHVGNRDDPTAFRVSERAPCEVAWFTLGRPQRGEVGFEGGELLSKLSGDDALGPLEFGTDALRADAAAAAAALLSFGISPEAVTSGIEKVGPMPHRGEVVAEAGSVTFVNDSKATNPHAALAGLRGRTKVVLIAGGLSKGVDLSPLAEAVPGLSGVVVMGESASEIAGIFEGKVAVRKSESMDEAVELAFSLAPEGGCVLLAPACASQDMFEDYRDRGEQFTEAAVRLARRVPRG
ncbi:MAG: UDP-N-acetylmuramoyl-L-alanine--D-glutamate ligase [Actinomycetota bacterium]